MSVLISNDSSIYLLHQSLILIYKPFIIGPVLFLLYIHKCKVSIGLLDTLLIILLIYQVGILIDIFINNLFDYSMNINLICAIADNNPGYKIPRGGNQNPDYGRLIRYLSANIAALSARRPFTRAIGLTIANAANILADVVSNEDRAKYWADQFNFFRVHGRFRGGHLGSGPFEIGSNPFEKLDNPSNYLPDFNFFKDFFTPVEHSIPFDTLLNLHFVMILGLFVLTFCVVLLLIYFFLNLFILFNKDFLLIRVKNKYALLYIEYVLFKSKVDTFVIGLLVIGALCFNLDILHFIIVTAIIVKT